VNDTLISNICTKTFKRAEEFQGDQEKDGEAGKKEVSFEWLMSS